MHGRKTNTKKHGNDREGANMRKQFMTGAVLASLLALAGVASAQTYGTTASPGVAVGGFVPSGYGWGYGHHASTEAEGAFRGLADLNRSIGENRYMSSLAAINGQEALSRAIDNKQKAVETYFQIKQINRAAREAARPQPLTFTQYAKLAKQEAPERLDDADYNRVMGRLSWPAVLASDDFAAERAALDQAFVGRTAQDVGVSTNFHREVRELTAVMQAKLRDRLDTLSPMEYIAAKKFLDSVTYESQQPLVPAGLAVNN
jgi:hypothetical protein